MNFLKKKKNKKNKKNIKRQNGERERERHESNIMLKQILARICQSGCRVGFRHFMQIALYAMRVAFILGKERFAMKKKRKKKKEKVEKT